MTSNAVIARLAVPVAIATLLACVAMIAFSVVSLVLPGTALLPERPGIVDVVSIVAIVLAFPVVALAIARRRPTNPVGWLFMVTGLLMAFNVFAGEYANRVAYAGASLPGAAFVAWLSDSAWLLGPAVALPLAIAVFPDGHLPDARWRPVLSAATAGCLVVTAVGALVPGQLEGYRGQFVNPFGAPGDLGALARWIADAGAIVQLLPSVLAIAAIAARLRRARGAERQQLKWLLYPLALFIVTFSTGVLIASLLPALGGSIRWIFTVALVGLSAVPIAAGVAILRYRLYDIDVVIRRTLVYGAVIAILGVVYAGLVIGLQALLAQVTGGGTLPVAVSTLVIAALFGPLRAWVRNVVDRRFYRSRYDAQRTLEAFAIRLRDEVELEAVGRALAEASNRAVQPATVGVWLRRTAP